MFDDGIVAFLKRIFISERYTLKYLRMKYDTWDLL